MRITLAADCSLLTGADFQLVFVRRGIDDRCVLHFDEAVGRELGQLGQHFVNPLCRLDEFDLDRHLIGQFDQSAGVQLVIGTEAGNTARHGRIRDAAKEQVVEDGGITRGAVILLALDHVNGHLLGWSAV